MRGGSDFGSDAESKLSQSIIERPPIVIVKFSFSWSGYSGAKTGDSGSKRHRCRKAARSGPPEPVLFGIPTEKPNAVYAGSAACRAAGSPGSLGSVIGEALILEPGDDRQWTPLNPVAQKMAHPDGRVNLSAVALKYSIPGSAASIELRGAYVHRPANPRKRRLRLSTENPVD